VNLRVAAVAVALLAGGCVTTPPQVQTGDWTERRAALQALDDWNLDGRVAVAAGVDGFSGGLNWQQRGEKAEITVRGPMGGAAILIRVDGVQTVVTDERGVTYDGEEAREFIKQNLGPESPLPIAEMRYWLVGVPAPGSPHDETLGDDRRLSSLTQSGWQVRYDRYESVGALTLPARMDMTTQGLRLRVAVSEWRLTP
jgi:outer membrane lipoprotein LolB